LTTVGTANLNVVSTEDCEAAYNDLGVSLTATIVLKSTLTEVGEYTCFWFNNANSFETGSKLEVDQLKGKIKTSVPPFLCSSYVLCNCLSNKTHPLN